MCINMCHFDALCHTQGWITLDWEGVWRLKQQNSSGLEGSCEVEHVTAKM